MIQEICFNRRAGDDSYSLKGTTYLIAIDSGDVPSGEGDNVKINLHERLSRRNDNKLVKRKENRER